MSLYGNSFFLWGQRDLIVQGKIILSIHQEPWIAAIAKHKFAAMETAKTWKK